MGEMGNVDAGVPFTGSLSYPRFVDVQRALTPRWASPVVTWFSLLVLYFIFSDPYFLDTLGDPVELLSAAIFCAVGVLILHGLTRFIWRRNWRKSMLVHGDVTGCVSAEHIAWRTELADSTLQWNKFIRARSAPDLLLLFYSSRCALYFPREFFGSDEDWAAFRALVDTKLPTR
jgi:hypothetical protein